MPTHGTSKLFRLPGAAIAALLLATLVTGAIALAPPADAEAAPRASKHHKRLARMGMVGKISSVPRAFVGITADDALWGTDADPGALRTMAAIGRMGAGTVRVPFLWSRLEPSPGRYDFELYDSLMERAARSGLTVLPVLFDPPAFRSSRPAQGAARGTYPPASNGDFANFAATLVSRYGRGGSFWRGRPDLRPRAIGAWQVWNEPNLSQYWPSGPNPAAYAAMLRAVGPAIRGVDPNADVVTAGLNESETGIPLSAFLRGMYRAGARGSFTSLGIHPYAPSSTEVIAQLDRARTVMRRYRDRSGMRVTEIGWPTGGGGDRPVSEQTQARLTRETMARLLRLRRSFRLKGVALFNWRDAKPYAGGGDFWGLHAGLHAEDGRPKPVVQSLTTLLGRVVQG